MNRTFGNVNENGNGTTKIQQGMHLYGTLLMMEFGPGKQTKTQVNSSTVKSINHIIQVNSKIIVLNVKGSCLLDKNLSEVGINTPVPLFIGIRKGRSGNRFTETGVVQLARECSQAVLNITEAFPTCKLSKTHDQKMLPARKLSYSVVTLVLVDTLLELIFWHECHQLCKNCFTYMHFRSNKEKSENMISNRQIF